MAQKENEPKLLRLNGEVARREYVQKEVAGLIQILSSGSTFVFQLSMFVGI